MSPVAQLAPDPGPLALERLMAALDETDGLTLEPFAPATLAFFGELARRLALDPAARPHAVLTTLAYWLRAPELMKLRERFLATRDPQAIAVPRGLAFHVAPANVETLFVYSWALSALAGNRNVVRLSSRSQTPAVAALLGVIQGLLADPVHVATRATTWLVATDHDDDVLARLSGACDVRVVWGGDATIAHLRGFPLAAHAKELAFGSRFSYAALAAEPYLEASAALQLELARGFYHDAYWFDQLGCSSPKLVVWLGEPAACEAASRAFFGRLRAELDQRGHRPETATVLAQQVFTCQAVLDLPVRHAETLGNGLTVIRLAEPAWPRGEHCGGGVFFETRLAHLGELLPHVRRVDQTLAHFGLPPGELTAFARALNGRGLDRLVPIGQALAFQPIWDGADMLAELSRQVWVQEATTGLVRVEVRGPLQP